MNYYDPMFYLCSDKMPFGIRVNFALKYEIDGDILRYAVNEAIKRYPHFAVKVINDGKELVTVKNDLPVKVFEGGLPYPLCSKEVNYHIVALSYIKNQVNFCVSHVISDGAGFFPFFKSVLYYYLCKYLNTELPKGDIRLFGDAMLEGETENPYPEEKTANAKPFYIVPKKEYMRLTDGGYVTNEIPVSYNFRVKEKDIMKFSHDNDASPCTLFSSIIAKAIRTVHPDDTKDIVSAISFNLRPGLKAMNNYHMLCSAIMVRYPNKLIKSELSKVCTCTRGAVMLQSQPENVLDYANRQKNMLEKLALLPSVKEKVEVLSKKALEDSVDNTFSVSYVGRVDYGSLTEHIENVHVYTDGSTYKTIFMEISSFDGWFYLTMQQGFTCDVYYKALLDRLKENGIEYVCEGMVPLDTPKISLPIDQ